MGEKEVTVSVTPNGYADAIDGDLNLFVMPHEQKMKVNELLDVLENPTEGKVYYYQMQNSNLTDSEEWADLLQDVNELTWATEAFGADLDAINFWMGDSRAVTSSKKLWNQISVQISCSNLSGNVKTKSNLKLQMTLISQLKVAHYKIATFVISFISNK